MNIEVSEEEARAIERRRARLVGQPQPRRTSRMGWVLNIIMTLAIGLIALVGGGLLYFGYVEPRLSHGSAAVQATPAPVATDYTTPSRQDILRTPVEDNQVAQPTTALATAPIATVVRQQAPGGAPPPTAAPAIGETAVTIDHLMTYPTPTSVLSQAEQEAAAASEEQMMLDRACQNLTEAQCSAQAGEAGNNIRIALWPTPTQEP
jgi:hypothetical protein